MDAVATRATPSWVGLFSEPSKRLLMIGNGVLFKLAGDCFVLTAAHVVELLRAHATLIGFDAGLWPFEGYSAVNPLVPGAKREDDPIDVGVLRIVRQVPDPIATGALTVSDLDLTIPAASLAPHVVLGSPTNRTNAVFKDRRVTAELNRYVAPELDPFWYGAVRRHPSSHVVLHWQEKLLRKGGVRSGGPPALHGVSGSGVWRIADNAERSVQQPHKLVAVFTEQIRDPIGVLVGTRVRHHLRLIAETWPDVATQLQDLDL